MTHVVAKRKPGTAAQVQAERERRLALGFTYDFGDARGVHTFATTEKDMRGWREVSEWASAELAIGNPSASLTILTETAAAVITATEWQTILVTATGFRQPIWQASFTLQNTDPIPHDYDDDAHWP